MVNLLNPSVIVIGGSLGQAGEHLMAGVREVVYRRSLPLATTHLGIALSEAGDQAAILGASQMVTQHVLTCRDRGDLQASAQDLLPGFAASAAVSRNWNVSGVSIPEPSIGQVRGPVIAMGLMKPYSCPPARHRPPHELPLSGAAGLAPHARDRADRTEHAGPVVAVPLWSRRCRRTSASPRWNWDS